MKRAAGAAPDQDDAPATSAVLVSECEHRLNRPGLIFVVTSLVTRDGRSRESLTKVLLIWLRIAPGGLSRSAAGLDGQTLRARWAGRLEGDGARASDDEGGNHTRDKVSVQATHVAGTTGGRQPPTLPVAVAVSRVDDDLEAALSVHGCVGRTQIHELSRPACLAYVGLPTRRHRDRDGPAARRAGRNVAGQVAAAGTA